MTLENCEKLIKEAESNYMNLKTEYEQIMEKMKAVKTGNCWVTGSSMYQRTDIVAAMILDFHKLLTEDNPTDLKYITKLQ